MLADPECAALGVLYFPGKSDTQITAGDFISLRKKAFRSTFAFDGLLLGFLSSLPGHPHTYLARKPLRNPPYIRLRKRFFGQSTDYTLSSSVDEL